MHEAKERGGEKLSQGEMVVLIVTPASPPTEKRATTPRV